MRSSPDATYSGLEQVKLFCHVWSNFLMLRIRKCLHICPQNRCFKALLPCFRLFGNEGRIAGKISFDAASPIKYRVSWFTIIPCEMVEMRGIEPLSESISTGLSPSAASVLVFRFSVRPEAGSRIGYPVSPLRCREVHARFPACLTPGLESTGEPQSARGAELSSKCEFGVILSVCI